MWPSSYINQTFKRRWSFRFHKRVPMTFFLTSWLYTDNKNSISFIQEKYSAQYTDNINNNMLNKIYKNQLEQFTLKLNWTRLTKSKFVRIKIWKKSLSPTTDWFSPLIKFHQLLCSHVFHLSPSLCSFYSNTAHKTEWKKKKWKDKEMCNIKISKRYFLSLIELSFNRIEVYLLLKN